MSSPNPLGPVSEPFGTHAERLRHRRGWVIASGLFSAALGILALTLTVTATIASVLLIGILMLVAGAIELSVGLRMRSVGRMILLELAGLLYIAAGLFAIAQPEIGSVVLTLMLGAGMLATGLVRMIFGFQVTGTRSRGALVAAGAVTALVGLLILVGWPGNSFVVLGLFLGIDLLLYGVAWTVLGLRMQPAR